MPIEKRNACRALLISPEERILLMKIEEPTTGWAAWITPGGGISGSETPHEGLSRELREELGLEKVHIGPQVWRRFHAFTWEDREIEQHEAYYLVETPLFDPGNGAKMEAMEKRAFKEFRWWRIADINDSQETFVPRALGQLLQDLRKRGLPPQVIEAGI